MKLGKKPARLGAVKLKLRDYIDYSKLPTPPAEFGHENLVTLPWGFLGNNQYGDCVLAGAAHETMLLNAEAGVQVSFTTQSVLSDYSAITGFDPNDPNTDQGTDMQTAAKYRQDTGVVDATGSRHKISAYLALTQGDVQEHCIAAYLFGVVGLGFTLPESAQDQFSSGQPWSCVSDSPIEGGHYTPLIARRNGMFIVSTWGAEQSVTDEFFGDHNDESLLYLSPEMFKGGKTLEGFDLAALQADFNNLKGATS